MVATIIGSIVGVLVGFVITFVLMRMYIDEIKSMKDSIGAEVRKSSYNRGYSAAQVDSIVRVTQAETELKLLKEQYGIKGKPNERTAKTNIRRSTKNKEESSGHREEENKAV